MDLERKKEFKKYEMEKEYNRQQELQQLDESHRKEAEAKHQIEIKQHKQHEKLHHPGSKLQLEEVWMPVLTWESWHVHPIIVYEVAGQYLPSLL